MGQKSGPEKEPAEQVIKQIRRVTRRQFSAEEKIRIVLSGLRGEDSIAGPAAGSQRLEGSGCRTDAGKPLAEKKHDRGWGGRHMKYPASEKLEIIRLVEQSALPVRR